MSTPNSSVVDGSSGSPGLEILLSEITAYRERWRQTERLAEQRLLMLLTMLAAVIAASAAMLTAEEPTPPPHLSSDEIIASLWTVIAISSAGLFVRLINARLSIVRSIVCLNYLRHELVEMLGKSQINRALRAVLAADSTPPPTFRWMSLPTSAAVISACGVFIATALFMAGSDEPPPTTAAVVALAELGVSGGYYSHRARTFRTRLEPLRVAARQGTADTVEQTGETNQAP